MKTFTKNIVAGAIATALLVPAVPAMAKDNYDRDRQEQNYKSSDNNRAKQRQYASNSARDNHGQKVSAAAHKFRKGEKFDRNRATNYREVNYRSYRQLKAPPRGYHYVQSGNDVLLVGITSGIVSAVVSNLIR